MDHDTKEALAKLTETVENGFAAVESKLAKQGKELHDLTETVNFIKDRMATKDEVRQIVREELKPIEDRLTSVESKISGTNRRLDEEAMLRTDLQLPKRVSDLEAKTFGAPRHPQHIPLT